MTRSLFRNRPLGKTLALLLSAVLVSQNVLPQTAYARQADVAIENHTSSSTQNKTVSNLRIDDVEKPQAGKELDGTARVTAAEGDTWDIPVMWVGDDMQLSTSAEEGRSYLPALAFFVPEGLALDGGTISVALSDSLAELFGTQDIISVYDAATGVTFILPASLRNFFARASQAQTAATDESLATETVASPASDNAALVAAPEDEAEPELAAEPEEEPEDEGEPDGKGAPDRLVDIFCAQTARNALSDEDLEWLINLILCRLQPQAVELLLNSFPAFRAAADKGEIGKEIGLYIYYQKGDDDGNSSHQTPPKVIAYVAGDVTKIDNNLKYAYMFAVDVNDLIKRDVKNNPVTNPATGKYVLLRDGDAMRTFENTIVHELFHAIMDDYNRTGMAGGTVMEALPRHHGRLQPHRHGGRHGHGGGLHAKQQVRDPRTAGEVPQDQVSKMVYRGNRVGRRERVSVPLLVFPDSPQVGGAQGYGYGRPQPVLYAAAHAHELHQRQLQQWL